jgi:hypothetical protein
MSGRRSPHVTDCQLRAWVLRKVPREEIARRCGTTISSISLRIHELWKTAAVTGPVLEVESDPDEQSIRAQCDEIQRGWSDQQRETRRVGRRPAWTPAVVPDFGLAHHDN